MRIVELEKLNQKYKREKMKIFQDSFEERYSKLKLYAIKLKKKLAEQTKHIEQLGTGFTCIVFRMTSCRLKGQFRTNSDNSD